MLALTGCVEKGKDDIVKDLDAKVKSMKGYEAEAKLSIKTGTEVQEYDVDIWHSKPSFYRVSLKNAKRDQSQIILRNTDGVFVLTPALNKSFRFQSDWPQNSSQSYLYESLVRDIIKDKEATFKSTDKNYVFSTKTNYQNHNMIPKQEITLDKKNLAPVSVKLLDSDSNVLVEVAFSKMKFDAKFDKGAFDMKKNMSGAQMEVPTVAKENKPFAVLYPTELPEGMKMKEEKELQTSNGKRVIVTYGDSKKSLTLIQEKAKASPTSDPISVSGEPVDLGFAVGVLTENGVTWSHEGVEYTLASKGLEQHEILSVARSIYEKAEK
jgi:outer membrane lipoprotein-sorting protein